MVANGPHRICNNWFTIFNTSCVGGEVLVFGTLLHQDLVKDGTLSATPHLSNSYIPIVLCLPLCNLWTLWYCNE